MNSFALAYPSAPAGIPPGLARTTPRYRRYVLLVVVSLAVFLLLYFGMIAATCYLLWLLSYPLREEADKVRGIVFFLWLLVVTFGLMLLIFLVKGLFRQRAPKNGWLEIRENEQPDLFEFIRLLCEETRAPLPRRVYLSPDVNAAVFYRQSLLNLVLPVRKNLVIGLGLVNVLTLMEFKAVLAHEFGHFSQNSMKLGQYVYVVNPIIAHMVYYRGYWDDLLIGWCSQDIRISWPGWALYGIVGVIRLVLGGLFRLINFGDTALRLEMEFNADLVAVSVSGSDALIHALARLRFAEEALNQAARDLFAAADHGLFTRDLFFHQRRAADFLRHLHRAPRLGLPPELPADSSSTIQVFKPDDDKSIPTMWATHPPNYLREQNAKQHYVRSPHDERSPWILWRNPEAVREEMTLWYYRRVLKRPCAKESLTDPEQVQPFIDDEHAETAFDARYHGCYDDRYIDPGDLDILVRQTVEQAWPEEQLLAALTEIYPPQPPDWLLKYIGRQAEGDRLAQLCQQRINQKFEFRGQWIPHGDLRRILNAVQRELADDRRRFFIPFDRKVFFAHYQMSQQLGKTAEELLIRYRSHLAIQTILQSLIDQHDQLLGLISFLSGSQYLEIGQVNSIFATLDKAHAAFIDALRAAEGLQVPPLKNVPAGETFGRYLLDPASAIAPHPGHRRIDGKWLQKFVEQLAAVRERAHRFHFKSLGGILAVQERIAADWKTGLRLTRGDEQDLATTRHHS